jgi:hypothetical protein
VSFSLLPFQGVSPQLLKHGFGSGVKKKERPNWPLLKVFIAAISKYDIASRTMSPKYVRSLYLRCAS